VNTNNMPSNHASVIPEQAGNQGLQCSKYANTTEIQSGDGFLMPQQYYPRRQGTSCEVFGCETFGDLSGLRSGVSMTRDSHKLYSYRH